MAPDQASLDAARKLLKPAAWPTLAADGAGLTWGEAQGSGATPYRVVISEVDAGFKCTCPSRKFPCKHALALMWLRAEGKQAFAAADPPAWVQDWLSRRRGPSSTPKATADAPGPRSQLLRQMARSILSLIPRPRPAPRRSANATGRSAKRPSGPGSTKLDLWLEDQLERGAAAFVPDAASACRTMAQRLVDAKAGALATRLDALPTRSSRVVRSRPARALRWRSWVSCTSSLRPIAAGSSRAHALREDVRQMIVWTRSQDDLLADSRALRATGSWHVFATRNVVQPDRLRRLETWLLRAGEPAGLRYALLLDFLPLAGSYHASAYRLDDVIQASSSSSARRFPQPRPARRQSGPTVQGGGMPPLPDLSLAAAYSEYQALLAVRPWLDEWPLAFRGAALRRREETYHLVDGEAGLALADGAGAGSRLWALSHAERVDGVGLWDGRHLRLAQASTDLGRWWTRDRVQAQDRGHACLPGGSRTSTPRPRRLERLACRRSQGRVEGGRPAGAGPPAGAASNACPLRRGASPDGTATAAARAASPAVPEAVGPRQSCRAPPGPLAAGMALALERLFMAPHPYDFHRLEPFLRAHAERLGPMSRPGSIGTASRRPDTPSSMSPPSPTRPGPRRRQPHGSAMFRSVASPTRSRRARSSRRYGSERRQMCACGCSGRCGPGSASRIDRS